jgi:hypothetical protein
MMRTFWKYCTVTGVDSKACTAPELDVVIVVVVVVVVTMKLLSSSLKRY